jgi:hypothetical protein
MGEAGEFAGGYCWGWRCRGGDGGGEWSGSFGEVLVVVESCEMRPNDRVSRQPLLCDYPSRKGGGNGNCLIVIFVLQTFTPCLPTVKKWFKNATATSTE